MILWLWQDTCAYYLPGPWICVQEEEVLGMVSISVTKMHTSTLGQVRVWAYFSLQHGVPGAGSGSSGLELTMVMDQLGYTEKNISLVSSTSWVW